MAISLIKYVLFLINLHSCPLYIWKPFLSPFMSSTRWKPKWVLAFPWALAFLTPITACSDSVFVSSGSPGLCLWSLYTPFFIWAQPESSCLPMQASCHLCLILCTLVRTIFELVGGDPWKSTSSPGLFSRTASFEILQADEEQFCSVEVEGWESVMWLCSLLPGSWTSLFTVTVAVVAPELHVPRNSSFSVNTRFSRLFLFGVIVTGVRKELFAHSGNLLDCLCSALMLIKLLKIIRILLHMFLWIT